MARNVTLEAILNSVRAEARLSLAPAHNTQVRDSHIILIQREQDRLWDEFDWPFLRVERSFPLQAGQRYYEPPVGIPLERVEKIEVKRDGSWVPLIVGFPDGAMSRHDSDLDERSWPVTNWRVSEDEQVEVWPIPELDGDGDDRDGWLKVTGIRRLRPLVSMEHRADLDDRMIILYVAASLLAAAGADDASIKLEAANRRYARMRGSQSKRTSFRMFGVGGRQMPRRPMIHRYDRAG